MSSQKTIPARLLIGVTLFFLGQASWALPITMVPGETLPGGLTLVNRGDLAGLGLTEIGSITLQDSGTGVGGAAGIFSGFDLDAIFLDGDGLLATTGDRTYASSFSFTAGTTRPATGPADMPNATHPGPTFGSLDATTIDFPTATLNTLDGFPVANVDLALGFLSLGDGGRLEISFGPAVSVGSSLYLMLGEVGGQPDEELGVDIDVQPVKVPEPQILALLALGLISVGAARRRRHGRA